jgi:hypothetical protein
MPRHEYSDAFTERGKRLYTPADMITTYLIEQHPLRFDSIRALIEPLAGSSFMTIALDTLKMKFDEQRLEPPPHIIMPSDLFLAFFKRIYDTDLDHPLKGTAAMNAEIALWSHLTRNVAVDSIYPDGRLEPGEMAFHQMRHDDVWHDEDHRFKAFIHAVGEWQFFKDGFRVGQSIPMQRIDWTDRADRSHLLTILPEGSPSIVQFYDHRSLGIAVLPKALQVFRRYTNLLFVSEQFDFQKALRKSPPGAR